MADDWVDVTEAEAFGIGGWEDIPTEEIGLPTGGGLEEFGKGIVAGTLDVAKGITGTMEAVTPILKKFPGLAAPMWGIEKLTGRTFEEEQAEIMEQLGEARAQFPMTHRGASAWAGRVIGQAIPYMGAALAGGYAVGPAGAAMVGFSVEGQNAYESAVARGASEGEAQLERVIVGSINAGIEALQIGRLMKFHKTGKHSLRSFVNSARNKAWGKMWQSGKEFGADILRTSIEESLEEFAQEGVSMVVPLAVRGDYPIKDGKPDWLAIGERLGEAALGGFVAGGVLGGAGAGLIATGEAATPSIEHVRASAKRIRESNLGDIEKARHLVELESITGESQDIPESTRRRFEITKKFEAELIEYEAKRPELEKQTEEAMHKKFGKIEEIRKDVEIKDPILATQIAKKAAEGYARTLLPEFQEKFSRDEITELMQAVRDSNLSTGDFLTLSKFFQNLMDGVLPHPSGVEAFDKFFGTQILQKGFRKRPLSKARKVLQVAREPFNLLKAMVCSCDFSAGGIQALMVAPNHPKIWGQGVGKGYRAFFSSEYVQLAELEMKTDPRFDLISKYAPKLITEIGGGIKGEELFVSELAHRIPGIGKMVRASDRAFVTTLNNIRSNLFYQWCEQHGVVDINTLSDTSVAEIKEALDHIGNLTGRALGKEAGLFEKYAPELGAAFWSPRLYLATARSMTDWATKSHIRKEAAADLLQAFGVGMMILALAGMIPGNEVELDPRSSDFAKIKRGNARITFFGQHTQMMRLVAQLVLGQKKATATGRIYEKDRLDIALRFMRSKLSPTAAIPVDIATGTTFLGEKMRWEPEFMEEYVAEKVAPMFLQDVADAIRFQGLGTALWTSPLAVHGIGAQIYEPTAGSESARIKNHYAHQMYGADWDELGPIVQQAIRLTRPAIESYERKARMERENFDFAKEMFEEQNETARRVYKSLPKNVQKEFDRLEVEIKDVSRRIGSNWYLNLKRYKQYEEDLKKILKRVVPQPMKSPGWNKLDENMQREILQALVEQCRKHVRQQIIVNANIEDVMRR
ncbi:MAG: hypothetical protein JSW07_00295 [bacterium]|nr:MAG: hypothetical protein JSW07_00295 [bacterium]